MTQSARLNQLFAVWRDAAGDVRSLESVAAGAGPGGCVTPQDLRRALDGEALLTANQCRAVASYFKVPAHYLSDGDPRIQEQLDLLGQLVTAGVTSVRLRGAPSEATRKALLAALGGRGRGA